MHNKVIWSEGMFLQPQHFQQQDRHTEYLIHKKTAYLRANNWGFAHYSIDQNLLSLGKVSLLTCSGILSDGMPFDAPTLDHLPLPLDVAENTRNQLVYFALPLQNSTGRDDNRYSCEDQSISDTNSDSDRTVILQLARLKPQLLLESDHRANFSTMTLARIKEIRSNQQVILDEDFIPSCIDVNANIILTNFVAEVHGLLQHRAEMLAYRLSDSKQSATAEVADFMLLQMINRFEPLLAHLTQKGILHPEQLFNLLLQLLGEISTFTQDKRRPPPIPIYQHDQLTAVFTPIFQAVRRALSLVLEQNAVNIALNQRDYGTWIGEILDKELLRSANFVLAVYAELPLDAVRNNFPQQAKIAPIESIRNLVSRALPGIGLQALPVAPRQIPYHSNFCYFALTQTHELWQALLQSSAIALHIGGNFPGLKLELWAIKG